MEKRLLLIIVLMSFSAILRATESPTPILKTKDQSQQCIAIHEWVKLARQLVGNNIVQGRGLARKDWSKKLAPIFADDVFPIYFGKKYFGLTSRNKKYLINVLRQCSRSRKYSSIVFSNAFQTKEKYYPVKQWQTFIASVSEGRPVIRAAEQKNKQKAVKVAKIKKQREYQKTVPQKSIPHKTGDLLFETSEYTVYDFREDNHDFEKFCTPFTALKFSIVINDTNAIIDQQFLKKVFDESLYSLRKKLCPADLKRRISAFFYFKGVHFDSNIRPIDISRVYFIEEFFLVVRATQDTEQFEVHRPFLADSYRGDHNEMNTLAGLKRLAAREFRTVREVASVENHKLKVQEEKIKLQQHQQRAERISGALIEDIGIQKLFTGENLLTYFESRPLEIYEALVGYGVAVSQNCLSKTIPGGLEPIAHTLTKTTKTISGTYRIHSAPVTSKSEKTFFWPSDHWGRLKESSDLGIDYFESHTGAVKNEPEYIEVMKVVKLKGCGSKALIDYHNNISMVSKTVWPTEQDSLNRGLKLMWDLLGR